MIHKKWFILAASILLVTGCSNEEATTTEDNTETEEVQTEESVESSEGDVEEQSDETEEETVGEEAVQAEAQYRVNSGNWSLEPIADAPAEAVLFTIDDAPDRYGLEMAQTLKELNIPAIFFVNGHFIATEEKQEILKEIHELGFAIGNHTDNHPNLQNISEEQQRDEIVLLSDKIEGIIGERPKFFRAPFGVNTDFSRSLVEEEGMVLMNWSYGYDWESQYMNPESLADIMVNTEYLRNGANLLMHDREWTAEALPGIVEGLKEKGYTFIDPDDIEGVEVTE
ncbi:MAG TPA: polysaccharide deacetylase family protein [Planococcus sp. (in: firmicutes)]|nr:polysaccharide deacetylase family protein [Planococcus sp. (in: firmicutes)]